MNLNDRLGLGGTASIVTGAGSGIGRACALLLAQLGSGVCVVDRDARAANRTVAAINEANGQAFSIHGDVREPSPALDEAVAPTMLSVGKGSMVNVSSVAGIAGSPGAAHYGAAKAGLINLTRTLALEWAPKVRVNCLAPDFIRTAGTEALMTDAYRARVEKLIPLGRLGTAQGV